MPDSLIYQEWYKKAEQDLRGAKIMFEHVAEDDFGFVAFHCQQAIEKKLKGMKLKKDNKLIREHNLLELYDYIVEFYPDIKKFQKDLSFVNGYYVKTRYPQELPKSLSQEDAAECIRIAEEILGIDAE